ncbi:MAG: (d)CMP kinase [Anaerovorax sp.]
MDEMMRIAIDGPSGAGKSTIAKNLAKSLQVDYIDTGAMYRAVAYKIIQQNVDIQDESHLKNLLDTTEIDFFNGNIILDGQVINDEIRTPEISEMASKCSSRQEVREKLVELQRNMGEKKSIIMDGRDIGTNVLPNAQFKFFLTASSAERAKRRWLELVEKGENVTVDQVEAQIIQRDHTDMTRALNPLKKAHDAVEIDTTGMSVLQVTEKLLTQIRVYK